MKKRWTKFAVIGLIALLVMSLGVIAVFAQDDTTPDAPATPYLPFGRGGYHGDWHHGGFHGRSYGDANDDALAEALGITVEELQAARQKVAAQRIAQAVEDGYLTQEQGNIMLAMQAIKNSIDHQAILAEALGVSVQELEAAREAGTMRDLLGDIDLAELHENVQAALQAAIQQAVTDLVITQEQADLLLEQMENGLGLQGRFERGHHGFGRGHGGFHGFRGAPQADDADGTFAPWRSFRNAPAFDA